MTDDGDDGMVQKAEPQIERKRLLARSEKVCHQFVRTFAPLAAMTSWLGVVRRDRVGGRFGQNGTGLCWDWQNRPLVAQKHLVQCQGLIGFFLFLKKAWKELPLNVRLLGLSFRHHSPTRRAHYSLSWGIYEAISLFHNSRADHRRWNGTDEERDRKKHKTQNLLKNRYPKAGRLVALLEERKEVTRGTQKPRRIIKEISSIGFGRCWRC